MSPCPFDAPRPAGNEHWDFVATLSVSSLYLSKDQTYRGYCVLIFDPHHAERLTELTAAESMALSRDMLLANSAIDAAVRPDHMNVALLGNVVRHLHWHIIPRYRSDPRWGAPIWPTNLADMRPTLLPAAEQQALVHQLRATLASI